jgi:hypothetical protein
MIDGKYSNQAIEWSPRAALDMVELHLFPDTLRLVRLLPSANESNGSPVRVGFT